MAVRKFKEYLYLNFFDKKFLDNKSKYIFQCLLATAILFAVLMSLNVVANAVVIASIGATTFVVFMKPHKVSARSRYIIGSYIVGLIVGSLCSLGYIYLLSTQNHLLVFYGDEIFGAIAVGITAFIMVITELEHPPAAALAFGMVLREWSIKTVIVTILAIFLMLLFRKLLSKYLIDLM